MTLSRNFLLCCLRLAVTVMTVISLILSLLQYPPLSGGINGDERVMEKMTFGSRPPSCVNKCMRCKPCRATLVIPPHDKGIYVKSPHGGDGDDNYYHLSWKCMCKDKLYEP